MMAKKKQPLAQDILTAFMTHCLEHESYPNSVYKFCKNNQIDESDFYASYASIDSLKNSVWKAFYDNAHQVIQKNKGFDSLSRKDRLLTFYFTFFEVLSLNRSYVLFALAGEHQSLKHLVQLKQLRRHVKEFAEELIDEGNAEKSRFSQNTVPLFAEAAWVQLLFVLKFWINDTSTGFDKTDALIEKSVQAAFEVFDNTQMDTLIDLGKFLWKEVTNKA